MTEYVQVPRFDIWSPGFGRACEREHHVSVVAGVRGPDGDRDAVGAARCQPTTGSVSEVRRRRDDRKHRYARWDGVWLAHRSGRPRRAGDDPAVLVDYDAYCMYDV